MSWIEETLGGAVPHREVWFESQGTRLYALEIGSGHPVVFLHGGLADHRAAWLNVSPLAAAYRLILPDLRGSGRSVYAGELSWQQLADDVTALLAHLGIDRAAVGGSSMGSAVALRCALSHPQQILGLILFSPVFSGQDRGLTPAQAEAMRGLGKAGEIALERGVEALIPLYARLAAPIRERAIAMLRGFDAASVAATTRLLASNAQPFGALEELAAIDIPALVVPGTDEEHPAHVAEQYAQHLVRARSVQPTAPELAGSLTSFCAALAWPPNAP